MPDGGGHAVIEAVGAGPSRRPLPRPVGLRRRRGRHRRDPGRGPRLRDEDHLGRRAHRRHPPRGGRRCRLLAAARRLRPRRLRRRRGRRRGRAARSIPSSTSSPLATPGPAAHRPRLRLPGGGPRTLDLEPRRSRATSRPCCASSSCRTATSSPAGPPSGVCSDGHQPDPRAVSGAGRPRRSGRTGRPPRRRAGSSRRPPPASGR